MVSKSKTRSIKIIPVGNSRGIRIPKIIIQKYGFADSVILEETENGILIRNDEEEKLTWEQTYQAMASEDEDWSDFDTAISDGLDDEE
jgi:antitoxin MazE